MNPFPGGHMFPGSWGLAALTPQELVTASGFGAPLALPVTSIVPAAVGASDARRPLERWREMLQECVFRWGRESLNLNIPFPLLSCSSWYHPCWQQTEVIGVFCRSAGADQNSEQALRALLGGLAGPGYMALGLDAWNVLRHLCMTNCILTIEFRLEVVAKQSL